MIAVALDSPSSVTADGRPVPTPLAIVGRVLGRCTADLYREDLAITGVGSGRCGFSLDLPADLLKPRSAYAIGVRRDGDGARLPGGGPVALVPVRPATPNRALRGRGFGDIGGDGNAARLARRTAGFALGIGALSNAPTSEQRVGVAAGCTVIRPRISTGAS